MELTARSKLEKEGIEENSEFDNLRSLPSGKTPKGINTLRKTGLASAF